MAQILEGSLLASDAYDHLNSELTCLHQKSTWARLGALYALPPISCQRGTKLLAAMEWLKPKEEDLWFWWQFISHL